MRGGMNSNQYEILFRLKISLRCSVSSLLVFTWIEAKWNSNWCGFHIGYFDRNKISNRHESFMWTKIVRSEICWEVQTCWILSLMLMCVWNSLQVLFYCSHFDRNEISFQVIKYHVNTTRNQMPTRLHQNIGSFWNAAEMKRHVNRTCFHASLKSQTNMSSFRLSCERTLIQLIKSWYYWLSQALIMEIIKYHQTYWKQEHSGYASFNDNTVAAHLKLDTSRWR